MNMSVTELMDYRLENPDVDVKVDTYITEKLISRERSNEVVENYELWGSMSKEKKVIGKLIGNYKKTKTGNIINVTR